MWYEDDSLSVPMRDSCLNHEGTKTPRLIGSDWNDNVSAPSGMVAKCSVGGGGESIICLPLGGPCPEFG